jgi:hypothetical protein
MAGSNDYILKLGADGSEAEIAGQMDGTMTVGGAPVEITNKSNNGHITYMEDFVAGKQIVFAVNLTLLSEAVQNSIKAAVESGGQLPGVVETGVGGEQWQCDNWVFTGRSDGAPVNSSAQMSVNVMTSGAYAYTAPTV